MSILSAATDRFESSWITQDQATEVLSHYEPNPYELDPKSSYLSNPLARLSHHSWLNASCVGRPKEAHFGPTEFDCNGLVSTLRCREVVICHQSKLDFRENPDRVYLVKRPDEGQPSILLVIDGVGVYVLRHESASKAAEEIVTTHVNQLLGPIACLFRWSTGRLAFHKPIEGKEISGPLQD